MFGKEITASTAASVSTGAQLGYTLPPGEDKTSARESGAALPLGVQPGTATIHHEHTQLFQSSKAKLQKTCYSSGCSEDLCTVTYLGSRRCLPASCVS